MDRYLPNVRVVTAHTGAEFESGAVHRARGVNEPMPGVEPEPAGVEENNRWAGGHDNFRQVDGRQKRLRPTPASKKVDDPRRWRTGKVSVMKGDKASEDDRWIYILDIKSNGTKTYLCRACGKDFCGMLLEEDVVDIEQEAGE
jgi:hypothetical protein